MDSTLTHQVVSAGIGIAWTLAIAAVVGIAAYISFTIYVMRKANDFMK